MKVSEQLKAAVQEAIDAGETRYAVAKGAGIRYTTFARWLDEDRDIRASTIDRLAEYFGLSLKKDRKK